jgi:hypothetical protein
MTFCNPPISQKNPQTEGILSPISATKNAIFRTKLRIHIKRLLINPLTVLGFTRKQSASCKGEGFWHNIFTAPPPPPGKPHCQLRPQVININQNKRSCP